MSGCTTITEATKNVMFLFTLREETMAASRSFRQIRCPCHLFDPNSSLESLLTEDPQTFGLCFDLFVASDCTWRGGTHWVILFRVATCGLELCMQQLIQYFLLYRQPLVQHSIALLQVFFQVLSMASRLSAFQ